MPTLATRWRPCSKCLWTYKASKLEVIFPVPKFHWMFTTWTSWTALSRSISPAKSLKCLWAITLSQPHLDYVHAEGQGVRDHERKRREKEDEKINTTSKRGFFKVSKMNAHVLRNPSHLQMAPRKQ